MGANAYRGGYHHQNPYRVGGGGAGAGGLGGGSGQNYSAQIQGCNVIHIVLGLVAFGLSFTQFSPYFLENFHQIDFRLLNWIHILTGGVGIFMVQANYGSIGAKVLYNVSIIVGLFSTGFYAATITQVIQRYREILRLNGDEEDPLSWYHKGRIAICGTMLVISFIQAAVGWIGNNFLNKLACDTTKQHTSESHGGYNSRLCFVAWMKLTFGLLATGLGIGMEVQYKMTSKNIHYVKIGWQIFAGCFTIGSALVDFVVVYGRRHSLLNLKVSVVISVISGVLSLRAVDFMMRTYFLADVVAYTNYKEPPASGGKGFRRIQDQIREEKQNYFTQFTLHTATLGTLVVAYFHSIISALEASTLINKFDKKQEVVSLSNGYISSELKQQRNCLGVFQFLWGSLLIALSILSLVPWEFSKGYTGGQGVFWIGILFITSGSISGKDIKTMGTGLYVISSITTVLAFEYSLHAINQVIQSSTAEPQKGESDSRRIGRIVLFSIQSGILIAQFFTGIFTTIHWQRVVKDFPIFGNMYRVKYTRKWCYLGVIIHFFYGFLCIGVHIASVIAIWKYDTNILPNSFISLTVGSVVLLGGIILLMAIKNQQFLLSSALITWITASLAFFVTPQAITNLYYLDAAYKAQWDPELVDLNTLSEEDQHLKYLMEIAFIVVSIVVGATILQVAGSVISGMSISYLLHHHSNRYPGIIHSSSSSLNNPFGGRGGRIQHGMNGYGPTETRRKRSRSMDTGSTYVQNKDVMAVSDGSRQLGGGFFFRNSDSDSPVDISPKIFGGNGYPSGETGGSRYFGKDFRTYTEHHAYKYGGTTYGYSNNQQNSGGGGGGPLHKQNSSSQTNIRNVFDQQDRHLPTYRFQ